jgi:hypothetical protein
VAELDESSPFDAATEHDYDVRHSLMARLYRSPCGLARGDNRARVAGASIACNIGFFHANE